MTNKGICKKHGEFNLFDGCPKCLAEKRGQLISTDIEQETEKPEPESEPSQQQDDYNMTALVNVKPEADMEVTSFYAEACTALRYAEIRVIQNIEDLKPANDDLVLIAKIKKALEEKRREYLKPLQEHQQAIRTAFDTLLEPILKADKITRDKILEFQQEQEIKRREEERINRLRIEAAEAEMQLKGELTESVDLVEVSPEAPKHVHTEMGTTGLRDNWKWEVLDFAIVPDGYKVIDGSLLTAIAKKHHDQKPIPGVRFYNEPILQVRAK